MKLARKIRIGSFKLLCLKNGTDFFKAYFFYIFCPQELCLLIHKDITQGYMKRHNKQKKPSRNCRGNGLKFYSGTLWPCVIGCILCILRYILALMDCIFGMTNTSFGVPWDVFVSRL